MTDANATSPRGPILIDGDDPALGGPAPSPADAPPPPEALPRAADTAAGAALKAAGPPRRRRGALGWFGAALTAFVSLAVGVATWDFVAGLLARNAALGAAALILAGAAALALVILILREIAGLSRLKRVQTLRRDAERALREEDLALARRAVARIDALLAGRSDAEWGRARLRERGEEVFDADALMSLAERECLAPLDVQARRAVEIAARRMAATTALAPLAALDVLAALWLNLAMIRRIAEIYGGRAGGLGSVRLLKAVAAHLLAAGVISAADDLVGPLVGGGALAKLSRRFGEGLVNGALTARVGVAAIEVCRPLPFVALDRPRARSLVASALSGLFDLGGEAGQGGRDRPSD
ncbi:MAG: TIGR01620 family protein [Pseudomonadota bacterium]